MIKVDGLSKKFAKKEILKNISFDVKEGTILSILGENGAGKTTLLNCILKLIPYEEGKILFNEKDIKYIHNSIYYSNVAAVLENSENIYYYLTGYQNIIYFGSLYNLSKTEIFKRTDYWINLLKMREFLNQKVGEYSRGMVQKLSIIISLLSEPKLLLLDEPTLGLDVISKNEMIKSLKDIVKKKKISIILITHQMDIVENINSEILFLKNGKIFYLGNLEYFKKYNQSNSFCIKFEKNGKVEEIILKDASFDQAYNYTKKHNLTNVIEIYKKELNLEEIIIRGDEKNESTY